MVTRMRSRRQTVILALALAMPALAVALPRRTALASVSVAVTWEGLLRGSAAAAIATAVDSTAIWENGRIYTYTRVRIDRVVAGTIATGEQTWVRTMGGVVGDIGQLVEGEAALDAGRPSLLFLRSGPAGAFEVTARGQGQFPIVNGIEAPARVVRSNAVCGLVLPRVFASAPGLRLAAEVLHDRPVDEVARDIVVDWARVHAR